MSVHQAGPSEKAEDGWRRIGWRRIIDEHLAKALGNSFRQQILWILNERIASPSEIAKELRETLNKVCHHIKVLKDAGCIELVGDRTVGNRVQHFYKATSRAFLEGTEWPAVPETVKAGLRATLLENIMNDAIDAVVNETYDAYIGAHMSWTPMLLDKQGRESLAQVLERALLEAIAIQEGAKERLASSGAMGASYTVSILGYSSVGGKRTVRPPVDAKDLTSSTKSKDLTSSTKSSTKKARKAGKKSTKKSAKTKVKGKKGMAKATGVVKKSRAGKATPKSKRKGGGK